MAGLGGEVKAPSLFEHRARQPELELVDCPDEWRESGVDVEPQAPHDTFVGLMSLPVDEP